MRHLTPIALAMASILSLPVGAADAPAPTPPGVAAADREWRAFVEPMLPLGAQMAAMSNAPDDPQLRNEVYRQMLAALAMGYMALYLGDPAHPVFWPEVNQAFNFLAPNPDNTYILAPIEGSGTYRIEGYRGTVRMADLQIGSGTFLPRGTGAMGPNLASHDLDTLHIAPDGAFSVLLSATRPAGYTGDWWPLGATASYVLIRQVSYDWLRETDGRFAIQRLDTPAARPRPTAAQLQDNLATARQWMQNLPAASMKRWNGYMARGLVNRVELTDLTALGGVGNQFYIEGAFELGADEALIWDTELPADCRYWNVQLTDTQWSMIDAQNRQTSLNGHTAVIDGDGRFRAVISSSDPGVPNWLDSAGYATGAVLGRWTRCSSAPTPTLTRVKFADLRKHLPRDTPHVTAAQREESLRLRRVGAQLRRKW